LNKHKQQFLYRKERSLYGSVIQSQVARTSILAQQCVHLLAVSLQLISLARATTIGLCASVCLMICKKSILLVLFSVLFFILFY